MNFLADENIDQQIVERLRVDGHDVIYIAELDPGITDEEVLEQANQRKAILLTADKDFGELVFRQAKINTGVILIHLAGLHPVKKADLLSTAIKTYSTEFLQAFTVLSPGMIRVREKHSM